MKDTIALAAIGIAGITISLVITVFCFKNACSESTAGTPDNCEIVQAE